MYLVSLLHVGPYPSWASDTTPLSRAAVMRFMFPRYDNVMVILESPHSDSTMPLQAYLRLQFHIKGIMTQNDTPLLCQFNFEI